MSDNPHRDIVDRLVDIRHRKGLTQAALATRMFVKRESIAKFETRVHNPTLGTVLRYAGAVGAHIEVIER